MKRHDVTMAIYCLQEVEVAPINAEKAGKRSISVVIFCGKI